MMKIEESDSEIIDQKESVKIRFLAPSDGRKYGLLFTDGLRHYKMNVPEAVDEPEHCELYFCLPDYWKLDKEALHNPNFNFPIHWIKQIMSVPIERDTFIAEGHSFPAGNPPKALSALTKQQAFILSKPVIAEPMNKIADENGEINFLGIVPIYKQELNYKLRHGSKKFFERFNRGGNNEKVNLARSPFKLKRFFIF